MSKNPAIFLLLYIFVFQAHAQINAPHFNIQMVAGYTSNDRVPFWLESNRSGNIPLKGASTGLIAGISKKYSPDQQMINWSYALSGRLNAGRSVNFTLLEGYMKIRKGIFEMKAGRSMEITGLCDSALSSGSISVSGNAPGIPVLEISIPEYYTLPFLGRMFSFKGNYAHGWMGTWQINDENIPDRQTYLHQKSLYARFGKENWRLKLYWGINHQAAWGCEKKILGDSYPLNGWKSFMYVNTGKGFTHDSIRRTRVGNHLGSIDIGFTYEFKNYSLFVYRQTLYDASALYYLANLRDGLNGVSLTNKKAAKRKLSWNKLLFEFLYTKNQGGETWSPWVTTPFEDYYNNAYYRAGWSYKQQTIGTPFITPAGKMRKELPYSPAYYFGNNRVMTFHLAMQISVYNWYVTGKASFSKNYGTYLTAPAGKLYHGENVEAIYGIFPVTRELSALLEMDRKLSNNFSIHIVTTFDQGGLFDDSLGIIMGISKFF